MPLGATLVPPTSYLSLKGHYLRESNNLREEAWLLLDPSNHTSPQAYDPVPYGDNITMLQSQATSTQISKLCHLLTVILGKLENSLTSCFIYKMGRLQPAS